MFKPDHRVKLNIKCIKEIIKTLPELLLSLFETIMLEDIIQYRHPGRGDVKIVIGGFNLEHKGIRVLVFFYPAHYPSY